MLWPHETTYVYFFSRFVYFLGTNKLTVHIFADHPGQSGEKEEPQTGKSRAKKGPGKTVSTFYRLFIFRRNETCSSPFWWSCYKMDQK